MFTLVPSCVRVTLTRCSREERIRSNAVPPPSASPTPTTAVRRMTSRREGPRETAFGLTGSEESRFISVAMERLRVAHGATRRGVGVLMLVVLAALDLDQVLDLVEVVPADAFALDQLRLADVAAHALLEVDVLLLDRAGRARVLAHRAHLALRHALDPERREQRRQAERGAQRAHVAAVEARDDRGRDQDRAGDQPQHHGLAEEED